MSKTNGVFFNNMVTTSGQFYNNMVSTSGALYTSLYNDMINTSGSFYQNVNNTIGNRLITDNNFNAGLITTIGNNLIVNSKFNNSLVTTIGNNLSNTSSSFYNNITNVVGANMLDNTGVFFNTIVTTIGNKMSTSGFANTVGTFLLNNAQFNNGLVTTIGNNLMTNDTFNKGFVNTIGNNLISNSVFLNNLASTLSSTQNSYYTSLIGPIGTVSDSKSIYNSLAPFTLSCTTDNYGMLCSTTYNTKGPIMYDLGPTGGSFNTTYNFGKNAVLQIGDWKLSQGANGNLQFTNRKDSSSGMEIANINVQNATIGNIRTQSIVPLNNGGNVNIQRLETGNYVRLRSAADYGRSLDQNGELIRGWSNNNAPNQMWYIQPFP
jgi:hypothetical protein